MRKFILLAMLVVASVGGASAALIYQTWCGKVVTTVDNSWFDSQEEADAYHAAIDEALCGPRP
ncbi:MAG TPA: hypothetical protein H9824_11125 [Candidatus Bacteroides pullicola]|uniref:Uncharacterized protein n=1 Tax=Candidatus Bacteroides pullicola TaxID=2838475 RepID=A0A9D1ZN93_9BACE|nr:hypothetical protein [Candidatus Bacteroides pullicola]